MKLCLALTICLFVHVVHCDEYGKYPSTYPFKDESYTPPDLVPGLDGAYPSRTFDDKDPGGYYYNEGMMNSMDKQTTGPSFYMFGKEENDVLDKDRIYFNYADHFTFTTWQVRPSMDIPLANWNCTAKTIVFEKADFPGVINGDEVCTDCCSSYISKAKYGSDMLDRVDFWSSFASTNGCAAKMSEEVYCTVTDGWHHICLEAYPSRTDRLIQKACFDSTVRFLLECSLVKAAGVPTVIEDVHEPKAYVDTLSVDQQVVVMSLFYMSPDRACQPYSYFNPADDGSSDSSDTLRAVAGGVILWAAAGVLF